MSISSARCWSAVSVLLDGQSMFATVATHTPRISRSIGGGAESTGGTIGEVGPLPLHAARRSALLAARSLEVEAGRMLEAGAPEAYVATDNMPDGFAFL